jgi:squalene-hopene/tetraprenyl-beta-curcumene cyclase
MRIHHIIAAGLLAAGVVLAEDKESSLQRRADQAVERGLKFLAASQQPDGGWLFRDSSDPAFTALVANCFIQEPSYGPEHPIVRRAIEFMLTAQQPDGGIYVPGQGIKNYQTSVCLMALSAMEEGKYEKEIGRAQQSLKEGQWDEGEGYVPESPWYGGAGYGRHKRPDLSNTQMMLEALHQSGLPADDPVYQKALQFVSRCQMLGETNDLAFAQGATDGGFIYTAANDGESKAGTVTLDGRPRLRSYGSMTYAGFKSLLYAGLTHEDPRVKAAFDWIREHYTLDVNPNMPGAQSQEGLYYYYHVFARALQAWGEKVIVDAEGKRHDWRDELRAKLIELQRPDGSWVNEEDRWREGNPYLVTSYAILALQTARLR